MRRTVHIKKLLFFHMGLAVNMFLASFAAFAELQKAPLGAGQVKVVFLNLSLLVDHVSANSYCY